ncbi:MAG: PQQ-binding-like beta-propeller repeat protein [Ktedonobacteraceae bacterium]
MHLFSGIWKYSICFLLIFLVIGLVLLNPLRQQAHAATIRPINESAGNPGDLNTYMGSNARTGYDGSETVLNSQTISRLKLHWQYHAGGAINTQPVVVNKVIYWGSWDGYEHATDLNGNQLWQTFLGTTTGATGCTPASAGVASTATVTTLSINGVNTQVVLVGGGNSHFYALDAVHGTMLWNTPLSTSSNTMIWDATTFYNGSVYIGISSYGDCPVVQGQLVQMNAATGTIEHTFTTVASTCLGGGIWGSPALDTATGMLYVATGNANGACGYSFSLIELNATTLQLVSSWQVPSSQLPGDSDFGSTPTLFTATINTTTRSLIGLVNKQGFYYVFDRTNISAGPLWEKQLSPAQNNIASSAWDGKRLYEGSIQTLVNGQQCVGSVRALAPGNGKYLWQYCSPGKVQGEVTVIPGVIIVGAERDLIALNATTGQQLFLYRDTSKGAVAFWGAATVSNGVLYVGGEDGILFAFGL